MASHCTSKPLRSKSLHGGKNAAATLLHVKYCITSLSCSFHSKQNVAFWSAAELANHQKITDEVTVNLLFKTGNRLNSSCFVVFRLVIFVARNLGPPQGCYGVLNLETWQEGDGGIRENPITKNYIEQKIESKFYSLIWVIVNWANFESTTLWPS